MTPGPKTAKIFGSEPGALPLSTSLSGELSGFLSGDFVLVIHSSQTAADCLRWLGQEGSRRQTSVSTRRQTSKSFRSFCPFVLPERKATTLSEWK
jgi:hypothetical protein